MKQEYDRRFYDDEVLQEYYRELEYHQKLSRNINDFTLKFDMFKRAESPLRELIEERVRELMEENDETNYMEGTV